MTNLSMMDNFADEADKNECETKKTAVPEDDKKAKQPLDMI